MSRHTDKEPEFMSFEDLYDFYFDEESGCRDRSDLPLEKEKSFVNDVFDLYEYIGFEDTFHTEAECYTRFNGMRFWVRKRASCDDSIDLQCLPQWHIAFENGEKIIALPEEICTAERCDVYDMQRYQVS